MIDHQVNNSHGQFPIFILLDLPAKMDSVTAAPLKCHLGGCPLVFFLSHWLFLLSFCCSFCLFSLRAWPWIFSFLCITTSWIISVSKWCEHTYELQIHQDWLHYTMGRNSQWFNTATICRSSIPHVCHRGQRCGESSIAQNPGTQALKVSSTL